MFQQPRFFAAFLLAPFAALTAPNPMTVIVFDQIGTEGNTLRLAVETARGMFTAAGIATEWKVCEVSRFQEPCELPPSGSYLEAHVVADWMNPAHRSETMGFALLPRGGRGLVSYALLNPAKVLAIDTGQALSVILGCVIAHEVGHLMGLRHSPYGVMKAIFERRDLQDASRGFLHFAGADAQNLRAQIQVWMRLRSRPTDRSEPDTRRQRLRDTS